MKEPFRLGHVPALDGLRGIAVLMVMARHATVGGQPPLPGGFLGVDLFFVLSGFLITSLIVQEWQSTGRVDLAGFFRRRALRLLPAMLAVLAVTGSLAYAFRTLRLGRVTLDDVLPTLFYYANWTYALGDPGYGLLGHTWSLSVEGQFYLLWGPALALMLCRISPRSVLIVALCLAALVIIERWWLLANGVSANRLYYATDTHSDGLMIGGALALILQLALPSRSRLWIVGAIASMALIAVALLTVSWGSAVYYLAVSPVVGLGSAMMITALVLFPGSWFARGFGWRPLAGLGRISYGLYLWHLPTFGVVAVVAPEWDAPTLIAVQFATSVAVAAGSYRWIEAPFLRMKRRRLDVSRSPTSHSGSAQPSLSRYR